MRHRDEPVEELDRLLAAGSYPDESQHAAHVRIGYYFGVAEVLGKVESLPAQRVGLAQVGRIAVATTANAARTRACAAGSANTAVRASSNR